MGAGCVSTGILPPFRSVAPVIEREDVGPVTVLRLSHGKANALDIDLVEAMGAEFSALAGDGAYRAVVLTGTGSIFSAGVDLFRVLEGGNEYIEEFIPALSGAFSQLFMLPLPVIAAINGHAIAGGCVLASACDYRLMSSGTGTIGVPELRVQVPFPTVAIEILRFAAAGAHFQELVYHGRTYLGAEAYERGLIDEIVPEGELVSRAIEVGTRLQGIPRETFLLTKRQVRQPALDRIERLGDALDAKVRELWLSPATRDAIESYVAERLG